MTKLMATCVYYILPLRDILIFNLLCFIVGHNTRMVYNLVFHFCCARLLFGNVSR